MTFNLELAKKCAFTEVLNGPETTAQEAFIDVIIRNHRDEACDEFGDIVLEGRDFADSCMKLSGAELPRKEADNIVGGFARCLQLRYLGACAAAGCPSREMVSERIAAALVSTKTEAAL